MLKAHLRLYFVAGSQDVGGAAALLALLAQALAAGITAYQFREKGQGALQGAARAALAAEALARCRAAKVPFFVDDDVALALQLGADGLHLGQSDAPLAEVYAQTQGRLLLGLSINNLAQARAAQALSAVDYFGVGPIFATQSKPDATPATGPELIAEMRALGITRPIVGIGGITPDNAGAVRAAGADGVAVISALTRAPDLRQAVAALRA